MNVASRELCQKLWLVSNWTDTDNRWYEDKGVDYVDVKGTNGLSLPAYDLGYLLRQLPSHRLEYSATRYHHDNTRWRISAKWLTQSDQWIYADTPEDAAAKLAIELFKSGVLK